MKRKRESIKQHLTCGICLELLNNPIRVCQNEHYFCAQCIKPIVVESALVYTVENGVTRARWDPSGFHCPTCRAVVSLPEILSYRSRLIYTLLPGGLSQTHCEHCDCVFSGQDRAKHTLLCKDQLLTCQFCQVECIAKEFNAHLVVCQDTEAEAGAVAKAVASLVKTVRTAVLFFS